MIYNKIGLIVLSDDQHQMLLLEEWIDENDHTQGTLYKIIGGTIQPGEDHMICLSREVKEELGCDIDLASLVHIGQYEAPAAGQPQNTVSIHLYSGRLSGELSLTDDPEIVGTVWFTPDITHPKIQSNIILREQIIPDLIKRNMVVA